MTIRTANRAITVIRENETMHPRHFGDTYAYGFVSLSMLGSALFHSESPVVSKSAHRNYSVS